jgi:predicted enzyme related to lactoylglutathione lyase
MANNFCWYELITSDKAAAAAFYERVAGWSITDSGMPGMDYAMISAGETPLGGIMTMPDGPPPIWMGYIAVDDIDAFAGKVKAAGGAIHKGPDEIPGVGRFAVANDPQGAPFVLFQALPGMEGKPPPFMTPGSISWHELHSRDWEAGFAFYSGLFGWSKDTPVDMGPMGTYQLFRTGGEGAAGGMFNSPAGRPMWLYYIGCDDIDAAKARVEQAGGTIIQDIQEVPGGAFIFQVLDPQGAMFAMVGMRPGASA